MFCETGGDESDWGVVLLEENGVKENVEVGVYQRVCAYMSKFSMGWIFARGLCGGKLHLRLEELSMELRTASYSLIMAGVGKRERARVLCGVGF